MNVVNIVFLIRVLFVLAMMCLLVVAGAWLARGEGRPAAKSGDGAPRHPRAGPTIVEGNLGYPVAGARRESIDAGAVAPAVERRAA